MEYARLRQQVSELEKGAAKARRADRREEALTSLEQLKPGDVIEVPSGKFAGYAVVIDPGTSGEGPRPFVVTAERQARRLSLADFPTPVVALMRLKVPRNFSSRNPQMRRDLASALRTRTHGLRTPRSLVEPRERQRAGVETQRRGRAPPQGHEGPPVPRLPRPRGARALGGAVVQAGEGRAHPAAPGRGAHQHRRAAVRPGVRGADGRRLPGRRHRHRARASG